jgi:hypothetical protein
VKKRKNIFDLTFLGEVKKIEGEWELFAKQALLQLYLQNTLKVIKKINIWKNYKILKSFDGSIGWN